MKTAVKNPVDMMMDSYLQNLSTVCWAQDQGEKILKSYMDQGSKARAESQKVAERFSEQIKLNQAEMQKLIDGAVKVSLEAANRAHKQQLELVKQQVEILQSQVASMSSAFAPVQKG